MHSPRDIRRRIKSVTSTAQITKAMQMVAASKMRKAQQAALNGRPFAALLYRFQRKATTQAVDFSHPLLEVREVRKRAVILIGGDKGLCGALNSNLFRVASQFDPQPPSSSPPAAGPRNISPAPTGNWSPSSHTVTRPATPRPRPLPRVPAISF